MTHGIGKWAEVTVGGADAELEVLEFGAMARPEVREDRSGRAGKTRFRKIDLRRWGTQHSVDSTPRDCLRNYLGVNRIDCCLESADCDSVNG